MEEKVEIEKWEKRLNEIALKMENEKLSISEAQELYEEGAELLKKCLAVLDNAKGKIVKIQEGLENAFEEDLD